jgi:hypothetical protein
VPGVHSELGSPPIAIRPLNRPGTIEHLFFHGRKDDHRQRSAAENSYGTAKSWRRPMALGDAPSSSAMRSARVVLSVGLRIIHGVGERSQFVPQAIRDAPLCPLDCLTHPFWPADSADR